VAIVPRPVEGDYDEVLFDFIVASEGDVPRVYSDHRGIPTLGLGYAMLVDQSGWPPRESLDADLAAIGIVLAPADRARLAAVGQALSRNDITAAKDLVSPWTPGEDAAARNNFSFLITRDQSKALFALLRPDYEAVLRQRLGTEVWDELAGSREMVALFSLAYNSPGLIGPGLTAALRSGARESAWFEIRFRSNRERHHGLQNRRDHEAAFFGLTNTTTTLGERQAIARLLREQRGFIEGYLAEVGRSAPEIQTALADLATSAAHSDLA
jgi:GH24 family phage-related lysozyme (muramidase)